MDRAFHSWTFGLSYGHVHVGNLGIAAVSIDGSENCCSPGLWCPREIFRVHQSMGQSRVGTIRDTKLL